MIFSQVTGGSVEELLGPFSLTHEQFTQCAAANKFPDDMTYWMYQIGAADGSGAGLPGADWRQARVFAAATCAATRFNQAHPLDRAAAVGSDESANAWPALSWWFGRDAYSHNHDGILGPLVGKDIYSINGQALKVGDPVLKVLYETNTSVVLGVAKIAEFKGGGAESGDYTPSLVMSQANVEKCKKDLPSRVMAQAVITGDLDSVGVELRSRPCYGLGRNAQLSFNLPDAGPLFSLSCRVVLGTNAIEPPGKKRAGTFFTAPSDVRLGEDVSGPSESSGVSGPLGRGDFTTTSTVTYEKSDGPTNTVATYLICSRTGGQYGVFSNAEMLTKLASARIDEDSPFSELRDNGHLPDEVCVKLARGTKASLVPTKNVHQKNLFELLEDHERAATKSPGVLALHNSYQLDGLVLQGAVEDVVIGELIGLSETFRARDEEGAPTIENVLAAERIDGLIGRLVEASCREGMANEPARCSSAVDVAVVIIAQLMEAAETNAEALQRIESSQQPRRPDRLDLTKLDYELATNKGPANRPDWQFQSAAKWKLKTIRKNGDGAWLYFTRTSGRAELESPPIKVSDINDVALSVAQLDRRVRLAGGARAGPKLVTIIKAHPTFA